MAEESRYSDFSDWENEALTSIEERLETAERNNSEDLDQNNDTVFSSFQGAAEAVSNLYRERHSPSQWVAFQSSALAVTDLYKECKESYRRGLDAGISVGNLRRSKEIVQWLRKRNRMIRREEITSFLSNRSLPTRVKPLHPHRRKSERQHSAAATAVASRGELRMREQDSLQVFQDAVQLRELERGMHVVSVHRQRGSTSPNAQRLSSPSCSVSHAPATPRHSPERRKRSPVHSPDSDGESDLGIPQHKRFKFP